jgi:hypothetical protein
VVLASFVETRRPIREGSRAGLLVLRVIPQMVLLGRMDVLLGREPDGRRSP